MRESKFIEQNKDKWLALEKMLEKPQGDPDRMNDLFVQVTDDLSYSRTFYRNRSVRVYLNSLAQRMFSRVYSLRKTERSKLVAFWTVELPQLVYEARKEFRLSFGVFILSMLIGVLSGAMDPEFVRQILGDDYVEMTLENIKSGDPMRVYKESGAFAMWLGITVNNLWVAFLTFITGLLYMIGSIWFLIRNGIMVGAFQYFFVEHGLFRESFLTIWIHGTLEISAIIIAGAAGLTMGSGLVFPGTYSRIRAFQLSARRGLKIMLGITPIFILAAFFEGYLTRHTDTPDLLRLLFILVCLAFVIGYFVWLPVHKARKGFPSKPPESHITPDRESKIDYSELKSVGQIFSEVFVLLKRHFAVILRTSFLVAIVWCLVFFGLGEYPPEQMLTDEWGWVTFYDDMGRFFVHEGFAFLPLLNGLSMGLLATVVFTLVAREATGEAATRLSSGKQFFNFSKMAVGGMGLSAICVAPKILTFLLMITLFPILLVWMYVMIFEDRPLFRSFSRTISLAGSSFYQMMGIYVVLMILGALFMLILDSGVFLIFIEFIGLNLYLDETLLQNIVVFLRTFFILLFLSLIFSMLLTGIALLYHVLAEVKEARTLRQKIRNLGNQKRLRGMEWEANAGNGGH